MNFRDKDFLVSFLLILVGIVGVAFPAFVRFLFWIVLCVGAGGIVYWIMKNLRRKK